ncbi:MAG: thiol-disulfide isomerase/thioredoxin [Lentimonas sp.]|jgi:thiol-disulfide isomerase/thioredoxin
MTEKLSPNIAFGWMVRFIGHQLFCSHLQGRPVKCALCIIIFSVILPLLSPEQSRAQAFEVGTQLSLSEDQLIFVQPSRYNLKPVQFGEDVKVLIFFYSASWCGPCQQVARQLKKSYSEFKSKAPELEFVTYSVDLTPRARADYLREARYPWPAIEPSVIDHAPWVTKLDNGTPQFQAFTIEGNQLIALTTPGDASTIIHTALHYLK